MSLTVALLMAAELAPAPICADRPAKANAVCTVPSGKVQLETGAIDWSLAKDHGTRTATLIAGSSFLKFGLSDASDLEIGFTPYAQVTVKQAGSRSRGSGFGDVVVRYKQRLTGPDARLQVAAIPFIKLPTASSDIGNGKAEGGLAVPVSFSVGGPVTMTLGPEVDILADADGSGRHVGLVNLVNLSATVAPRLSLSGELWGNWNLDPAGTVRQASSDVAIAYAVTSKLQLDLGVNFGLTHQTSDVELYTGASFLF